MARTRTLAELRTEVRQRADLVGANSAVSNSQIDRYINQSIAELWDLLRTHSPDDWYIAFEDVDIAAGVEFGLLPTDMFLLRGVDYHSGSNRRTLCPFDFRDRNVYKSFGNGSGSEPFRYRLLGSIDTSTGERTPSIQLIPTPNQDVTITVWYIPHAPVLDADLDVWDGFNGWEEYVVLDAVAKCMEQEQNPDVGVVLARLDRVRDRIVALGQHADLSEQGKIRDVLPDELDLWYEEDGRRYL